MLNDAGDGKAAGKITQKGEEIYSVVVTTDYGIEEFHIQDAQDIKGFKEANGLDFIKWAQHLAMTSPHSKLGESLTKILLKDYLKHGSLKGGGTKKLDLMDLKASVLKGIADGTIRREDLTVDDYEGVQVIEVEVVDEDGAEGAEK